MTDINNSGNPKFFGRRVGRKIRVAKTALLKEFLPKVSFEEMSDAKEVFLEIGFGDGSHLAGLSQKMQNTFFIGAEVFANGVANLLSLMTGVKEGKELPEEISLLPTRFDNVRVWSDDVRLLFDKIPDSSLDKIFLLFPDPWPKKRHASRRFINPENLKEIHRILKPDGLFVVATDHKVYKAWTLREMNKNKNFIWTAKNSNDWRYAPENWVETKYQKKAIREGRKPVFFIYKKEKV
ncbi:MAG: tRNA (guanine(46)-N(7))-methyltransferase TrmB [Alphaproteobacteria bacterium]